MKAINFLQMMKGVAIVEEARKLDDKIIEEKVSPSLWKNKNFLLLWGASTLSLTGLQIYAIVMPLLIYEMSQSALAMSGIRVMEILPNVILGIIAGVIVDRVNRKRIMTLMVVIQWFAIGAILLLVMLHMIELWSLFLLGFLFSSSGYFFGNAHHSALPQIVAKHQLTEANAKYTFTDTLIRMIGPGIAGFILAATSFQGTMLIQFLCMSAMLLLIFMTNIPNVQRAPVKTSFRADIKDGIVELIGNRMIFIPTIAILFKNLASSMVIGVLIFFAVDLLGASESEVGLMLGLSAVGGLIGALTVKRMIKYVPRGKLFTYIMVMDMLGFGSLLFVQTWWGIGLAMALQAFAVSVSNIIYLAIRQEYTPNHLLGRVSGTSSMLMKLTMPIGLIFAGMWAEWMSVRMLFGFSVTILAVLFISMHRTVFYKMK